MIACLQHLQKNYFFKLSVSWEKKKQKNDYKDGFCTREYQLDQLGQFTRWKKNFPSYTWTSDSGGIRKIGDNQYSVRLLIKYSHSLQNSYLLSQTSRRFLVAAGFRLNHIVSWFLLAMILYFPRSLRSLPRKLHQQRRTIHHAKTDERKKPFLLNSSCYGQITPQVMVQWNHPHSTTERLKYAKVYDVSAALNVTPRRPQFPKH